MGDNIRVIDAAMEAMDELISALRNALDSAEVMRGGLSVLWQVQSGSLTDEQWDEISGYLCED